MLRRLCLALLWAAAACAHAPEEAAPPEACASLATRRLNPKALPRIHGAPLRTAELAVAHCALVLGWLPRVLDAVHAEHLQLVRVSIYLKCGPSAFSLHDAERAMPPGAELIVDDSLPNVGRCDHTWAHHLWLRWHTLADVVLFLKDSTGRPASRAAPARPSRLIRVPPRRTRPAVFQPLARPQRRSQTRAPSWPGSRLILAP